MGTNITTGQQLHRAILENPFDIDLRLVYSDYLEENGDSEWACFMREERTWCGKYDSHTGIWFNVYDKSDAVFHPSLSDYHAYLIRLTNSIFPPFPCKIETKHGFIDSITLSCENFQRYSRWLFSHHPITQITLSDKRTTPHTELMRHHWLNADKLPHVYAHVVVLGQEQIPGEIFRYIPINQDQNDNGHIKVFDDAVRANLALSRACVHFGRQLEDLSPLTFPS